MVIYTATYGREENGDIVCPFRKTLVDDSVIQTNDTDAYSECPWKNITVQIMKLCDKKKRCTVTANRTYYGNHCKGVYKVLKVIYACGEYFFSYRIIKFYCHFCTHGSKFLLECGNTVKRKW